MASLNKPDELNHETSEGDGKHEVERTDVDNLEIVRGTDFDNLEVVRETDVDNLEDIRGTDVDNLEVVRGTDVDDFEFERRTDVDKHEVIRGTDVDNFEVEVRTDVDKHEVKRRTDVDNLEVVRGTDADNLEDVRGIDVDNLEVLRGTDVDNVKVVPLSQEEKRVCYQPCTKHSKSKYQMDHFCKNHAFLVCSKCARKVHVGCSVVPVEAVCSEITLMDIKDFGRVVLRKKANLLRSKEDLDIKSLNHLAEQRVAAFKECQDMLGEYKAKFESLTEQFQTEIEEVFKKHSKIISDQIAEIDTIVANLDEIYREIQMVENEYQHEKEYHFIKIQDSVVKINRYLKDFRRLENSCETVSMKFHADERLKKFITKVSSVGTLKVRIKNFDGVSCVDDVVFPPTLGNKGIDKTRRSKYGNNEA